MSVPTESVLFTGFPGFIGARLLPRLAALRPEARLVCLVQPRFMDLARASRADLALRHPDLGGRLELLPGDITEPRLGLSETAARDVTASLTAAYHLAAV